MNSQENTLAAKILLEIEACINQEPEKAAMLAATYKLIIEAGAANQASAIEKSKAAADGFNV